jgi:hypothetical protein
VTRKVLVPVFPSERFYDAVVAAGDLVAAEGGLVTFLFTEVRPPEQVTDDDVDGRPSDKLVSSTAADSDGRDFIAWQEAQIQGLGEARRLLYERGIGDDRIDYMFADEADTESAAQAIADEAAAGGFDLVVLSRGYFTDEVEDQGSPPQEVAEAVQRLGEEVRLMVV